MMTQMEKQASRDALRYSQAKPFLDVLKQCRNELTIQQYRTIRGQAISGDVDGARNDLEAVLRRE